MWLQNDRIIMDVPGATTEVATLKRAVSEAENKAADERTEREKQEARVGEVQQELQALVKKHESLELDSKTRESELAKALESAQHAKAEAQKALQERSQIYPAVYQMPRNSTGPRRGARRRSCSGLSILGPNTLCP